LNRDRYVSEHRRVWVPDGRNEPMTGGTGEYRSREGPTPRSAVFALHSAGLRFARRDARRAALIPVHPDNPVKPFPHRLSQYASLIRNVLSGCNPNRSR
jgi:hypothetical protein